ncbi:putative Ig domain-containing protein [Ensifer sp.]|uniref:putative Ig domain-containing protein n=1 Tax=Ensifer sp. TaxID=1872086 RepID=UPI002898EEE1|nr:putative Ig domain-containing protein [Ensifer sp.]
MSVLFGASIGGGAQAAEPPSNDATLSNIWVGTGTLTPSFDRQVTEYSVSVPSSTTTIWMNADTSDADARYYAGGSWRSSGSSWGNSLVYGNNTVTIIGRAADGVTTKTYTVIVTRPPAVPMLTGASPATGTTTGGTSVMLTGTNLTGATAVTFGGTAATGFVVNSATQITATTPSRAAGAVNVTVTTPGGTATISNGHTYLLPTLALSPAAGSLPGGITGTAYSQTVTASLGTAPYQFAASGSLPAGMSIDVMTGVLSGTPSAAGSFAFTVVAADAHGATGSATYTLDIAQGLQPPVAANVTATVNANSLANPITLAITGDPAGSVAVAQQASHGSAMATGTTITYTPTVGYFGPDSFTYTATNAAGTSSTATVTITVNAPPSNDATLSNIWVGTGTLTPSFDRQVTEYSVSVPSSTTTIWMNADTSDADARYYAGGSWRSSGSSWGNSLVYGNNTVTIIGRAADGVTTKTYTVIVTRPPAVPMLTGASPATGTTTGGTSVMLTGTNLTGATAVTFGGTAATGFVVNSATQITATTPSRAAGAVNVVVTTPGGTATLGNGYTYVTPTLALSPAAGSLPGGTTGTAYSQTVTASLGTAPYQFAASGSLPAGMSIDVMTGVLSGTPSAAGSFAFTVVAADAHGATGSATYTLDIAQGLQPPVAANVTATVNANSLANPITLAITGDPAGSVAVAQQASHGSAMATGTTITYTPTVGYSGPDSFTYTATNAAGTSSTATVTITVSAPTLALSPAAGSLPGGITGTAYSQTVTASLGTAPYQFAASGSLPAGMSIDVMTGVLSGTPSAAGSFAFTVVAADAHGATGSATYTLDIAQGLQPPVAANVTATVNANSSANPITLAITGDPADSVAVAQQASHGTVMATGTTINYSPAAGYSGPDSFTYTATNAAGTSSTATVTITVSAPTLALSPAAGSLPGGITGTAYSQTVTASLGTAPYQFAASGSLPAGMSIDVMTGVLSGTPSAAGSFAFTVVAADAHGATGSATYTLDIAQGLQPPVAANVTATVNANSSANPITLAITGDPADSVAVAQQASHGTVMATGTTINYSPAAGYSGPDSFTYTATNAAGTSSTATVTITVSAPTLALSPAAGSLPGGITGTAYSQTVTASGGAAPYVYALSNGTLPAGLALDGATGTLSGTPRTVGTVGFTIMATDAHGAKGSVVYALAVKAPVVAFTFTPAAGDLAPAMAGEDYRQQIAATGGAAPLLYGIASGALPKGMVLNVSTGELTGPLDAASEGSYTFTVAVGDNNGATGTATYSMTVKPREVTVSDKVVNVSEGATPSDVYLNRGATGGPFDAADVTFVEPANAGTASIIRGQLAQAGPIGAPAGWYLQFTPNPGFKGSARVGFRLVSVLGTSNTGTVTYNLSFAPEEVAGDIDTLVDGFVTTRQGLISSSIYVPGLLERRQMQQATDAVTARMTPSEDGMTANFSTSLAQMDASRNAADGIESAALSPFNVWVDGAFIMHKREQNDGKWGSFAMLNLGADYLVTERALVGFSFHYDRMRDPSDADAELTGNGWLTGPYASFELGKGVFWDTSLLYGGSVNDIDTAFWDGSFDTNRWMVDTAVKGYWQIDEATVLTPKLRAVYFNERVKDYTVRNGTGDKISIEGFNAEQFRVSLGAEIARSFTVEDGSVLTPKVGVTAGYAGLDGTGAYASISAGVSLETASFWMLDASLLLNVEADGRKSVGGRVKAAKAF